MNPLYNSLPVFAQNLAWSYAGYRRFLTYRTPRFQRTLEAWEKTIDDPPEVQIERQWDMLRRLIRRAREHVPFYKDLPPPVDTGDPAESLKLTLGNIAPLEKSTYRERPRDFLSKNVPARQWEYYSTSGTTGSPLPVWVTPDRLAEYETVCWRHYRSCGVELDDPWISFGGRMIVPLRQRRPPFWRVDRYRQRTLFSIFHMSPQNLAAYVDAVHAAPARYVQGYPSALHVMARALLDAGRPLPPERLKAVFTSSESLLEFQRESIQAAFNAPVRDHYASTEKLASMTACSEGRLHVDMEFGLVEVEPMEETEEHVRGPLVVTGLGDHATPMLRYRIGDVGARSKTPCPCGRPGDAFLDVDGRIEDYVLTPDERLVGRLDHIFKGRYEVSEAQIIQDQLDHVRVLVVARDAFVESTRRSLLHALRGRLGSKMHVDLEFVDSIPREPNGKFRAVKSTVARLAP